MFSVYVPGNVPNVHRYYPCTTTHILIQQVQLDEGISHLLYIGGEQLKAKIQHFPGNPRTPPIFRPISVRPQKDHKAEKMVLRKKMM